MCVWCVTMQARPSFAQLREVLARLADVPETYMAAVAAERARVMGAHATAGNPYQTRLSQGAYEDGLSESGRASLGPGYDRAASTRYDLASGRASMLSQATLGRDASRTTADGYEAPVTYSPGVGADGYVAPVTYAPGIGADGYVAPVTYAARPGEVGADGYVTAGSVGPYAEYVAPNPAYEDMPGVVATSDMNGAHTLVRG